jgi:2-methylfumaryl-CoA hydratase
LAAKNRTGFFFEDFYLDRVFRHATPRTLSEADSSVFISLTGARHALPSAATLALKIGYSHRPIDDLLLFNIAFGKTVPDISLNAVANLGYAETRFLAPAFPGDTIRCESRVIGLKQNSSGRTGTVYVRSTCFNQRNEPILTWVRWVMVNKRDPDAAAQADHVPTLDPFVAPDDLSLGARIASIDTLNDWCDATSSLDLWEDYVPGERINHPIGVTVEEAEHITATRLYQNNARAHFDALSMKSHQVGQRLVYGGHIISLARALSYDGLENALSILAINGGRHVSPTIAGDTIYAFSEVIEKWKLPGRSDIGALRLRLVALKNLAPAELESTHSEGSDRSKYHPSVVLDLDYTISMPRRQSEST